MPPERIGKYEIQAELGHGGMGVVYKGYDPVLERHVAIKVMHTDVSGHPELRDRFRREARSAARLQHQNIVAVYDMGEAQGEAYIVMEYLSGRDLREVIRKREVLPFDAKLGVVSQICRGLDYAHRHEVVHRDIKPGNIRITADGTVKIMDFGLARLASSELTRPGSAMGTVDYMSPEQVRGARDLDARSDLYAVGVILYELVAYRKPFDGDSLPAIMLRIATEPHLPLSHLLPGCPRALEAIVDRALAKDRAERYASGEEMAEAIDQCRRDLGALQPLLLEEVEGLEATLAERRRELADRLVAGFLDDELFRLPVRAGDPADYGLLLHRHADLLERLRLVEERREGVERLAELRARARQQLGAAQVEECLATVAEIRILHPDDGEAERLEAECRQVLDQRRRLAEEAERRRLEVAEDERRRIAVHAEEERRRLDEERSRSVAEEQARLKAAREGRLRRGGGRGDGRSSASITAPTVRQVGDETRNLDAEAEATRTLGTTPPVPTPAVARPVPTRESPCPPAAPATPVPAAPVAEPRPPAAPATPVAEPRPAATARRRLVWLAPAAAVLVIVAVLIWRWPRPTPPLAGDLGRLSVEVAPWARIERVERVGDGTAVDVGQPVTPCWLELPAGAYRITASNPFHSSVVFEAEVRPGASGAVRRALPGFDAEREIDAALAAGGRGGR